MHALERQDPSLQKARIHHYLKQPDQLPIEIQNEVTALGEELRIYALCDLNPEHQLQEAWLVLTNQSLIYFYQKIDGWAQQSCQLTDIDKVSEQISLSCRRLIFKAKDGASNLLTVRYSHRQQKSMALIQFVVSQTEDQTKRTQINRSALELYRNSLLEDLDEAQAATTGSKAGVVLRLLAYLLPYRKKLIVGLFSAASMTLLSLVPPFLTGYILDRVIKPVQLGELGAEEAKGIALGFVVALIGVYLAKEFFGWLRLRQMSMLGEYVARDLREDVYSHLQKLSIGYFSKKQTGSLISRVSSDTDRIWDFVAFGVVEVVTSILMLTGLAVMLIYLDWPLGLLATIPVPFLLWCIVKHGQNMQRLFLRCWRKWSNLTDVLSDTIPGIRVVKAFNRENHETGRFNARNNAVTEEFTEVHKAWTGFWPLLMISIYGIIIAVWFFGVPRVIEATQAPGTGLTAGTFVSFLLYLTMFVQPIEVIGQMARMINRATSSAYRVFEVLDTRPDIKDQSAAVVTDALEGRVAFENVGFTYDGVRRVLRDISFEVEPGEMIGIVGPSGSGKTTLINLLARFYELDSGTIMVDGVDLRKLDQGSYRQQLGIVLQDPYLFHGTLLENIRYAKPDASLAEVIAASRAANAHGFISNLPHAYETMVGERGHTLSGGERQRVSIARAILRNPRILILDEATSAVDTETEARIQEALDRLVKGRTVFAIAHRLSTLKKANRLLVMKGGEIVEMGTHLELVNKPNGTYASLCKMQASLHEGSIV